MDATLSFKSLKFFLYPLPSGTRSRSRPIMGKSRSRSEPGQNGPGSPALIIVVDRCLHSIRFILLLVRQDSAAVGTKRGRRRLIRIPRVTRNLPGHQGGPRRYWNIGLVYLFSSIFIFSISWGFWDSVLGLRGEHFVENFCRKNFTFKSKVID